MRAFVQSPDSRFDRGQSVTRYRVLTRVLDSAWGTVKRNVLGNFEIYLYYSKNIAVHVISKVRVIFKGMCPRAFFFRRNTFESLYPRLSIRESVNALEFAYLNSKCSRSVAPIEFPFLARPLFARPSDICVCIKYLSGCIYLFCALRMQEVQEGVTKQTYFIDLISLEMLALHFPPPKIDDIYIYLTRERQKMRESAKSVA